MDYVFTQGTGTEADPYLVETAADLNGVRDYLDAHFKQMADIDLSGYANWEPIGTFVDGQELEFRGIYDGNGHTISNLTIDRPSTEFIGLFGVTTEATIKDLGLLNVNVTGTNDVGGLVGFNYASSVTSCYYDSETSGCSDIGYGEPKTTTEMKTQSTFVDWDFTDVWGIDPAKNDGYPYLLWQYPNLS